MKHREQRDLGLPLPLFLVSCSPDGSKCKRLTIDPPAPDHRRLSSDMQIDRKIITTSHGSRAQGNELQSGSQLKGWGDWEGSVTKTTMTKIIIIIMITSGIGDGGEVEDKFVAWRAQILHTR